jgi:hypothetical protein
MIIKTETPQSHIQVFITNKKFMERSDLLPALKGEGSPALLPAVHRFPPSIRGYICHLEGMERGQRSPGIYFDP